MEVTTLEVCTDVKGRLNKLLEKRNELSYSRTRVSATTLTKEQREEVLEEMKKVDSEIKKLAPMRISELREEQLAIEKKYFTEFKKIVYFFFGVSKAAATAKKQYRKKDEEIGTLEWYLEKKD